MNFLFKNKLWFVFLLIVSLLLGYGLPQAYSQSEPAPEKPNILWITSEDNSPFLGAYGDSGATTPNLDRLAERGVVYENAFATTPVCAPSRFTLITGLYGNAMGTENMRSRFPIPEEIKFFPKYLRQAGYYTTNNSKKDYNTVDQPDAWDASSDSAHYRDRREGQPFFHVRNFTVSHESRLHDPIDTLIHDPEQMDIPPYHPPTSAVKADWAHYYDQVTKMDAKVGAVLDELKQSGQAENTIIFYYSDHGGVLPRSKRFMFESGLHVPLIVYFPPKYEHLAPEPGRTDRLVSFVDFPATVLSLADITPPEYMHGQPFLGAHAEKPREYIHSYRARMDERIDLVRAVRDKQFLYLRNFMPHRIYGQHLDYLWKAPSMQSWHEEFEKGNLNEVQRRFFQTKPAEELYKISTDPHNVNNLADDPAYRDVLTRMRRENIRWMKQIDDLGVIPEEMIDTIRGNQALYDAVRGDDFPIDEVIETADRASRASSQDLASLAEKLDHPNAAIRFWAATGFSVAGPTPETYEQLLLNHTKDEAPAVRIAIAEALYRYGNEAKALSMLQDELGTAPGFAQLRAINTLQALSPQIETVAFRETLETLVREYDTGSAPKKYVHRAAEYLLESMDMNSK